jgi:dienelactone hydrolase
LTITGNPQSINGATWTYQQTIDGVVYDLQGILYKPLGAGIYPAVIINHGTGGNVNGYSKNVARKMVQWDFVCIATNLCHASGVPVGSPGDSSLMNWGASTNNYLRDMKCWDILAALNYVDTTCIMSFGHSRGAFVTTGLVATYPDKFSAAGHTAGGVTPQPGLSSPTVALATQITCPYIIHHGDADVVVPIAVGSLLNDVFNSTGIPHEFYQYAGYTHSSISQDSLMFERTRQWFSDYGCSNSTSVKQEDYVPIGTVFPNPAKDYIRFNTVELFEIQIFNATGQLLLYKMAMPDQQIDVSFLKNGIYTGKITMNNKVIFHKFIVNR